MEQHASAAIAGQRSRIIDLQQRITRDETTTTAGDITRRAERAMKRRLLA
jgi:hypothetical protein